MTLRHRGYLVEGMGMLTSMFGNGPRREAKKSACPKCGKVEVVFKEKHPDTDMNYMVRRCRACGHEEEV